MNWQSFTRIFKLGATNFWRNRWLSFAATMVMTLTLLVISIFAIITLVIGTTTDSIKSKMDISVYFNDSATMDQITILQQKLSSRTDVKEARYISKEEALEVFKTQQQGKQVAQFLDPNDNPLPRSLDVKATVAEKLEPIAEFLNQKEFRPIIHNVSYQENKKVIERLIAATSFIKEIGWVLSITFVIISILVVLNTIRLTIFTRKDEIEIMRLVGASDAFIKIPFVVEGLMYGFLATLLSTALLETGVISIIPRVQQYLGLSISQQVGRYFYGHFWLIFALELLIGLVIGVSCSLISIRKHVRV